MFQWLARFSILKILRIRQIYGEINYGQYIVDTNNNIYIDAV